MQPMSILSLFRRGQPKAAPKTYDQDLGWARKETMDGTVYTGYFRAVGLRYEGWILQQRKSLQFYILKPPIQLLRDTEFGGCFHAQNDGWWLIAFKPYHAPRDASSGIAAVQKALLRAFQLRTTRR